MGGLSSCIDVVFQQLDLSKKKKRGEGERETEKAKPRREEGNPEDATSLELVQISGLLLPILEPEQEPESNAAVLGPSFSPTRAKSLGGL